MNVPSAGVTNPPRQLVVHRNGRAARIAGSALILASAAGALIFAELTFRSTDLRCEPPAGGAARCALVERWPAIPARVTPLSPVTDVRTRAEAGRRGSGHVVLLLEHADLTVSEHQGVGALGDRAETVALRMRAHLSAGQSSETFALRQASPAFGVALLIVFLGMPLALLPGLFAKVRFVDGTTQSVRVGRGLLPARRLTWARDDPPQLAVRARVVGGTEIGTFHLVRGETVFDLGLARPDPDSREALARQIRRFAGSA